MANRRNQEATRETDEYRTVRLDRQALRDIFNAIEQGEPRRPRKNKVMSIQVNQQYEADSLDDVLAFERPIKHLTLTSSDPYFSLSLSTSDSAVHWKSDQPTSVGVKDHVLSIMEPRFARPASSRAFLAITCVLGIALGDGGLYLAPSLGLRPSSLAAAITLACTVILSYCITRWRLTVMQREFNRSIMVEDLSQGSFWGLYSVGLGLFFQLLALVATVIGVIVSVALQKN